MVRLHAEVPLIALLGLVHLWMARLLGVLGRGGRVDDGGVDDGAGGHLQPPLFKMAMRRLEDAPTQIVRLQQVAEAADRGLVRGWLAPQIDAGEGTHL